VKYIYLHGFASSPASKKARYFDERFREAGITLDIPILAPDFERLTITGQLEIVRERMGNEPTVLIGSSMGGYVAALFAAEEDRVDRVVLMAPAFGFADRWQETLGGERAEQWRTSRKLTVMHYGEGRELALDYGLVEDAAKYPGFPLVRQPALVLHGRNDDVVPLTHSEAFVESGRNRRLVVYDSGHELTDVTEFLWAETAAFLGLRNRTKTPE